MEGQEQIWLRRDDESEEAFEAFKLFLEHRSCHRVVKELSKSRQLITRWAEKYEWRKRVTAYDNDILEGIRLELKRRYGSFLEKQWKLNEELQAKTMAAISQKEFTRTGLKSLNEIKNTAFNENREIINLLGIEEIEKPPQEIIITRVPAPKDNAPVGDSFECRNQ